MLIELIIVNVIKFDRVLLKIKYWMWLLSGLKILPLFLSALSIDTQRKSNTITVTVEANSIGCANSLLAR